MIKVIPPGSFDFDCPVSQLVDVHSRGCDKSWLTKRAAALSKDIADIRPEPGYSFIHLIDMGAQEYYSMNRNGDGFNEKAGSFELCDPKPGVSKIIQMAGGLQEYHPTFLKHAHVFRHHQNKDPKKAIGEVKAAAYNQEMHRGELIIKVANDHSDWKEELEKLANGKDISFSMACKVPEDVCFKAGTKVMTEHGLRSIETIKINDRVLTHTGVFRKVKNVFETVSDVPQAAVTIRLAGIIDPIIATPNHPFFVLSGKSATNNQKKFRRKKLNEKGEITGIIGYQDQPEFLPLAEVTENDYCLFPIHYGSRNPKVDPWVVGLYLADGTIFGERARRSRTGHWHLSGVSWSLGLDKLEIIEKLGTKLQEMGLTPRLYQEKDKQAVRVSVHSRILAELINYNFGRCEKKRISQHAWFWSQENMQRLIAGWLDGDGSQDSKSGGVRGHSVLDRLAAGLQLLSFCAGIPASVHRNDLSKNAWAASPHVNVLHFSSALSRIISKNSVKVKPLGPDASTHEKRFYLKSNGTTFLALPIASISTADNLSASYNLSVATDETYVAGFAAVHNCSNCGNRARTRAEYCDHLLNGMCDITKTGHQNFAINDRPTFFDISKVFKPADRIALSLSKVASYGTVGGAQLAEELGLEIPDFLNTTPLILPYQLGLKMAAARKLAAIEKEIGLSANSENNKHLSNACPLCDLADGDMAKLKSAPLGSILNSLKDAQICLSVRDFLKLVLKNKFDSSVEGEIPSIEKLLPTLHRSAAQKGETEAAAGDNSYDGESGFMPRGIRDLIENLAGDHSLAEGPAHKRVQITIIRGIKPKMRESEKTASVSKQAELLAREYLKYQISFTKAASTHVINLTVLRNIATV